MSGHSRKPYVGFAATLIFENSCLILRAASEGGILVGKSPEEQNE